MTRLVGGVVSAGTVLTVYVWSAPVGAVSASGFLAVSVISCPEDRSRLYVPSCVAETVTRYVSPEPVRLAMLPVPVLSWERTKSTASTPVTLSLNVTRYTSVWLFVTWLAGLLLSIDVTVGAVESASMDGTIMSYTR